MSNRDVFSMSFRNLIKRKMRTFLTVLSVVIGITAIVCMISIGLAMNEKFDEQIKTMGDVTTITVNAPYNGGGRGMMIEAVSGGSVQTQQKQVVLDDKSIAEIGKIEGVVAATPIVQTGMYFKSGKYVINWCQVVGIYPEAMEALGYKPDQGRLLQTGDKYNVVFGAKAELQFYKQRPNVWYSERYNNDMQGLEVETLVDVMLDSIQMSYDWRLVYPDQSGEDSGAAAPPKPIKTQAVGILQPKDWETDQAVFMDIKMVKQLQEEQNKYNNDRNRESGYYSASQNQKPTGYDTVKVKCKDLDTVKKVRDKIVDMGFYAYFPTEYLNSMKDTAQGLQMMLGAVGFISLFVAAIGIANTMFMAIYERTKEIGVMKVIGAALKDIGKLFLLESAIIGFFGGALGIGLSYLVSYVLNSVGLAFLSSVTQGIGGEGGDVSTITWQLCALAMAFATVMGVLSGYFPARRAMRLSALDAIKTE